MTVGRASPMRPQTPATPPGFTPVYPQGAAPMAPAPAGPPRNSRMAIASLVLGVVGLLSLGVGSFLPEDARILGFLPLIASILAIIFASISLKDIRTSGGAVTGRGFAIAGLVLGIVTLAILVVIVIVAVVLVLFFAALCASCFKGAGSNMVPIVGLAIHPHQARGHWLSHHPDHPAFRNDVVHVHGHRFCLSCAVFQPVFIATFLALSTVPPQFALSLLGAGAILTLVHVASFIGLTRGRWEKATVKAIAAVGAAGYLVGAFHLEGPLWLRGALVAAFIGGVLIVSPLRRMRIQRVLAPSA